MGVSKGSKDSEDIYANSGMAMLKPTENLQRWNFVDGLPASTSSVDDEDELPMMSESRNGGPFRATLGHQPKFPHSTASFLSRRSVLSVASSALSTYDELEQPSSGSFSAYDDVQHSDTGSKTMFPAEAATYINDSAAQPSYVNVTIPNRRPSLQEQSVYEKL
jgi:hypothetical protein